jgi:hypothetical protein
MQSVGVNSDRYVASERWPVLLSACVWQQTPVTAVIEEGQGPIPCTAFEPCKKKRILCDQCVKSVYLPAPEYH